MKRWHQTLKADCIRHGTPLTPDDARRIIARFVEHYNTVRLHSAIGFVAPRDELAGRDRAIWADRLNKLQKVREQRRIKRNITPVYSLPDQPAFSTCG